MTKHRKLRLLWLLPIVIVAWAAWVLSPPQTITLLTDEQQHLLDSIAPTAYTTGNAITAYSNYDSMLSHMLADIGEAQESVAMQFFKFEDDSIGRAVASALIEARRRGVECQLMYDDLMCRQWRKLYEELEQAGVATAGYQHAPLPLFRKRDNYRNHRKIVVIDGRTAYTGGMNIAQRYSRGLEWGTWHDMMVRIEGPAVAALQRSFVVDWYYATDSPHFISKNLQARATTIPVSRAGTPTLPAMQTTTHAAHISVVCSGPMQYGPQILDTMLQLIEHSHQYIYMESPYYLPPAKLRRALYAAAERGVDVRILQPPRGDDGQTPQHASHYYYAEALNRGIHIGQYQPGFLHTKLTVIDDTIAIAGSANIDPRSYHLNQETVVVVRSSTYARQMRTLFEEDEATSHYIDPTTWHKRPWTTKLQEWLAHCIAWQL